MIKRQKDRQYNVQKTEGQRIQWPNEKGQKHKWWSTKHYTETQRFSNMNPTKNRGELSCSGRVSRSSCSISGTYHQWFVNGSPGHDSGRKTFEVKTLTLPLVRSNTLSKNSW
jgi:hypothetical protein